MKKIFLDVLGWAYYSLLPWCSGLGILLAKSSCQDRIPIHAIPLNRVPNLNRTAYEWDNADSHKWIGAGWGV